MFKTLTRTLKLGLTAITILTAGGFAGTAFAQTFANDRVGFCANSPSDPRCSHQIDNCIINPFGAGDRDRYGVGGCVGTFTAKEYIIAKVRYCGNQSVPSDSDDANNHVCRDTWGRPNAANWASQNRYASFQPSRYNRRSQFLRGTATGLNRPHDLDSDARRGSLNLKTARFNNVVLNSDIASGVGFFDGLRINAGRFYSFAGIFSGTDLGERITETNGVASWVGMIQSAGLTIGFGLRTGSGLPAGLNLQAGEDFILEVDYARKNLRGFIVSRISSTAAHGGDFRLDGKYTDSGIITGNFVSNWGRLGSVTGLIGKGGAVGAFIGSGNYYFSGGFVARPAHLVVDANNVSVQDFLNQTCAIDPFQALCFTSHQRATRILNDCIDTLPSSRPAYCTTAIVACLNNPFSDNCHNTIGGIAISIAKRERITECIVGGNIVSSNVCRSAQRHNSCIINPFADKCVTDPDFRLVRAKARVERINFCNNLLSNGSSNSLCEYREVAEVVCNGNFFGESCLNLRYYDNKRTERIALCNDESTPRNNHLCTPADVLAAICADNLFGNGCVNNVDPDGSYAVARTKSLNVCNIATNSRNSLCKGRKRDNICSYAPFLPVCLGHADSSFKRTEITFNACRVSGPSDPTCYGVNKAQASSGKVDAATWADGLITFENPNELSREPSRDLRNQFLKGTATELELGDFIPHHTSPLTTLTLASNRVGSGISLGGESADGVAFAGIRADGIKAFYAGILSGTDLGAPLTSDNTPTAEWGGVFQSIGFKRRNAAMPYNSAIKSDFNLKITFLEGKGQISAEVRAPSLGARYYDLKGIFDDKGVISGTIKYTKDTDTNQRDDRVENKHEDTIYGTLTGLIGEHGAVGAFIADMDDNGIGFYSGGFVAAPPVVNYTDWEANVLLASATADPAPENKFLAGTPALLANNGITLAHFKQRAMDLHLPTGTGDSSDGFFTYRIARNNNYAGILPTTNLGAPLDATTAVGVWHGFFEERTNDESLDSSSFTLNVNFGAGKKAGQITGRNDRGTGLYSFSADFNSSGVIDGTIIRSEGNNISLGVVSGLIGVEGAVGVFHSNVDATTSYIGGFLAHKAPAQ